MNSKPRAGRKGPALSTQIIKALDAQERTIIVNAAQDYAEGVFYYGQLIGGVPFLITSEHEVFNFEEARARGLEPHTNEVRSGRISSDAIRRIIAGKASLQAADLHARIVSYLKRFVHLDSESEYSMVALWVMGTYIYRALPAFPYIHLSGEKGSGKTTLMEILQPICFNGRMSASSTAALVYHTIQSYCPTLFIDEAERLGPGMKEVQATLLDVLNSGYKRSGFASRMGGEDYSKPIDYSTYSPKMFGGINGLHNVLQDRTITIHMKRRKASERVERYTDSPKNHGVQAGLRDDLYIFGLMHGVALARRFNEGREEIRGLESLENRTNELWAPLMLIAEHIEIEKGCASLTAEMHRLAMELAKNRADDDERDNPTAALVSELRNMLQELKPTRVENGQGLWPTDAVFDYLQRGGYPLWLRSKTWLTQKLGALGIRNVTRKVDGKACRCYLISSETVGDLCERYNVPPGPEVQPKV